MEKRHKEVIEQIEQQNSLVSFPKDTEEVMIENNQQSSIEKDNKEKSLLTEDVSFGEISFEEISFDDLPAIEETIDPNEQIQNFEAEISFDNLPTIEKVLEEKIIETDTSEPSLIEEVKFEEVNLNDLSETDSVVLNDEKNNLQEKSVLEENITLSFDDLPVFENVKESVSLNKNNSKNSIALFLEKNPFINSIFEEKVADVVDEFDPEIFEISKPEADDMIENIIPLLEEINESGLSEDKANEMKRYLHTFKGSVRMAGANKIGFLAHRLESLMDYAQERKINLFEVKDLLTLEMEKIGSLLSDPTQEISPVKMAWLDMVVNDDAEVEVENSVVVENVVIQEEQVKKVSNQQTQKEQKFFIRVSSDVVNSAINDAGEIRLSRTALEGMLENKKRVINDLKSTSLKLMSMLKEIEVQAETQIQAKKDLLNEMEDFDPLEFDRFTRLQELTRFMNETVFDIQDNVYSLENFNKIQETSVVQQAILTNNLLEVLMKVRLLPFDSISDRLYKITRNTSKELSKSVALELIGEQTEMDRMVLDKVTSPLEHLLRNSIAHGIESPDERKLKNKAPIGKINIQVFLDGHFIVIKLKDDGAGINVEKVRSIGIKKGLIEDNVNYSKDELVNLIFKPGFSTADTVSQVAGRGVGMDVVKSEITALGGVVDIETEKDQGTTFTITLPVAVATNQAVLTKVMNKTVATPAILIDEIISLKQLVLENAYKTGKYKHKDQEYDLFYMGHLLGSLDKNQTPEIKVYNSLLKIVYQNKSILVHVDSIDNTYEILVKSVGAYFSKFEGILGATLLGDGTQGLVVNPVLLAKDYSKINSQKQKLKNDSSQIVQKVSTKTILVVDDSLTVRRATSKLLEKYGYNVVLAKDGADGLEQLQLILPEVILSDIEMPRMDGFEFAKNVKNIDKYKDIPIIMITSRTADKHQSLAKEIGVEGFLGKPYKEDELLENIKKLMNKGVNI